MRRRVLGLKQFSACAVTALALFYGVAFADVPKQISYQGKLTDASGNPLTGTFSFRFKLLAGPVGGAPVFTETLSGASALAVTNGVFTVQLGAASGGIPESVFSADTIYIEIDVSSGTSLTGAETLSPRERLLSSAYAIHALGADRLGTGALVSTHTTRGDLQLANDLSAGYGVNATTIAFRGLPSEPVAPVGTIYYDTSLGKLRLRNPAGFIDISSAGAGGGIPVNMVSLDAYQTVAASKTFLAQLTLSGSTLTVSGQDALGYSLTLSSGILLPAGTVTAGLFVGSGAGLTAGSISGAKLSAGAIDTTRLAADAVTAAAILNGSITAAKLAPGAVSDASIPDGSLGSAKLAGGAVTSAKLAAGAVETAKLAPDAVTSAAILDGAVTASKLAPGTVGAAALAPLSLDSSKLAAASVDAEKLAAGSVQTAKLADDAVTFPKLARNGCSAGQVIKWNGAAWACASDDAVASGSVDTSKLSADSVDSSKILNGAVGTQKLARDAVTSAAILDGAVTASKLAPGTVGAAALAPLSLDSSKLAANSVDAEKLAAGSVQTAKLADDAVTFPKLARNGCAAGQVIKWNGAAWACASDDAVASGSVDTSKLTADSVDSTKILNGAVGTLKLAPDAVTSGAIVNGAVTAAKLAPGLLDSATVGPLSIDSGKLAATSVDNEKLAASAVTAAKIAALAVDSARLAFGAVDTNRLGADAVTATAILNGAVTAAKLAPGLLDSATVGPLSVDSGKLAASSVDSEKLAAGAVISSKIADLAIGSAKLALGSVDTGRLGPDAVTSTSILNGAITAAKLAPGILDSATVGPLSVDSAKLAANSVDSEKLAAGAVTPAKLDRSYLQIGGGALTGTLTLGAASGDALVLGSGASKSTFTATPGGAAYALQLSSGVALAGGGRLALTTGGYIAFPDGSAMTTASVNDNTRVADTGDTMTGTLTLSPASGNALVTTAGNIGLGAASPAARLDVGGGSIRALSQSPVTAPASGKGVELYFDGPQDRGRVHAVDRDLPAAKPLYLDGSATILNGITGGSVGVNTTSPVAKLDVAGGAIRALSQATVSIPGSGKGVEVYFDGANDRGRILAVDRDIPQNKALFLDASTLSLNPTSGGNVGVNTASPAAQFDVNGSAQFGSGATRSTFSATGALTFPSGYVPSGALDAVTKGYVDGKANTVSSSFTVAGDAFSVGGSTLVVALGSVGIGTTSPARRFAVHDSGPRFYVGATAVDTWQTPIRLHQDTSGSNYNQLETTGGGHAALTGQGTATGRLGLGTAAPATRFDVEGDAQFGSGATKSTFSATGGLTFPSGYVPAGPLEAATKGYVDGQANTISSTLTVAGNAFSVGASTLVVTSGRVGIGTANPVAALDVSGSAKVSNGLVLPEGSFVLQGDYAETPGTNRMRALTLRPGGGTALYIGKNDSAGGDIRVYRDSGGNEQFTVKYDATPSQDGVTVYGGINSTNGRLTIGGTDDSSVAGRLGVGLAAPTARLHVSSAGAVAANTILQVSSGTAAGQELLVVKGDGKIGIHEAAPVGPFHLHANKGSSGETLVIQSKTDNRPGLQFWNNDQSVGGGLFFQSNDMRLFTGSGDLVLTGGHSSAAGEGIIFQTWQSDNIYERARFDTAGNLGVGTAAPATKLEVNGDAQFGSGASKSTFTAAGALALAPGQNVTLAGGGKVTGLPTPSAASDAAPKSYVDGQANTVSSTLTVVGNAFSVGGSTLAVTGGKVGIGTASPAARLQIDKATAGAEQTLALGVAGTDRISINPLDAGSAARVDFNAPVTILSNSGGEIVLNSLSSISLRENSNTYVTFSPLQRVGVGTQAPATKLDIDGNAQFGSGAARSTFTASGSLQLVSGSTITSNGTLTLSTAPTAAAATPALFLSTAGFVGLGTATPAAPLEISNPGYPADALVIKTGAVPIFAAGGSTVRVTGGVSFAVEGAGRINANGTDGVAAIDVTNSPILLRTKIYAGGGVNGPINIESNVPDSASNVGIRLDQVPALTAAGTKLLSVRNNGAERASIDKGGAIATGSSVTASGFFGDGSGLTGVSDTGKVSKTGDTMTGQLTLSGSTLTVTGNAFSVGGSTLAVDGGRVGIGTLSPSSRLEVLASPNGPTRAVKFIGDSQTTVLSIDQTGAGNQIELQRGGSARGFILSDNTATYLAGDNGSAAALRVWNGSGYIDPVWAKPSGDVGVGTTNPSARLEVSTGSAVSGATTMLRVSSGPSAGQELLVVMGDGKVGLGRSAPAATLDVSGDMRVLDKAGTGGHTGLTLQYAIGQAGNENILSWKNDSGGTLGSINGNGVGIGTASGNERLYVYQNGSPAAALFNKVGASGDAVVITHAGSGDALRVGTNGASFVVDTVGKAGVGTTSPAARLHVSSAGAVAADTVLQVSSGTGTGQELLIVKGDGKVGIGTAAPGNLLTLSNGSKEIRFNVDAGADDSYRISNNIGELIIQDGANNGLFRFLNSSRSLQLRGNSSQLLFGSADGDTSLMRTGAGLLEINTGTAGQYRDLQVRALNPASGNIGVGTQAPSSTMTVAGSIGLIKAGAPGVSPTNEARLFLDSADNKLKVSVNGAAYTEVDVNAADDAGASPWTTSGADIHRATGKVGIGTTAPAAKLHVSSGTLLVDGDASASFQIGVSTLLVKSDGSVGLGTASPGARLSFAAATTASGGIDFGGDTNLYRSAANTLATDDNLIINTGSGSQPLALDANSGGQTKLDLRYGGSSIGRLEVQPSHVVLSGNTGNVNLNLWTSGTGEQFFQTSGIERQRITREGEVGIGTTDPSALLHVSSANAVGADTILRVSSGTGTGQELLVVKGDGKSGLGMASPAERLEVAGNIKLSNAGNTLMVPSDNTTLNFRQSQPGNWPGDSSGWEFRTGSGATRRLYLYNSSLSSGFNLLVDGSIGVGTTAPSSTMTVAGSIGLIKVGAPAVSPANEARLFLDSADNKLKVSVNGAAYTELDVDTSNDAGSQWTASGSHIYNGNASNVGIGATSPSARLHVSSANAVAGDSILQVSSGTGTGQELLVVKGDGKVGVGTSAPDVTLHVSGLLGAYPKPWIADYSSVVFSNNTDATIRIRHVGGLSRIHTDAGQAISLATHGENDRISLAVDGRVGVGATAPVARLHVSSANAVAANTILQVSSGTGTGQELLVVKGNGSVGIGTASPGAKLDVEGNIRVGGGRLDLLNGTSNYVDLGNAGFSAPAANSSGYKLLTLGALGGANTYGLGVEAGNQWYVSNGGHNFYSWQGGGSAVDVFLMDNAGRLSWPSSGNAAPSASSNGFRLLTNGTFGSPNSYGLGIDAGAQWYLSNADHRFYSWNGGGTANELARISGAGDWGLGTSVPAAKFHLSSGTLLVDGNAATALRVGVSSFAVTSEARVGIGTTGPAGPLDVKSPTTGEGALIARFTDSTPTTMVEIFDGNDGTAENAANAVMKVKRAFTTGRSINAAGTINALGADYAEWIAWPGPKPEPGTIVRHGETAMVVSSTRTAAFTGNDVHSEGQAVLLAFVGQVPTKVRGKVGLGDYILPNDDGTGTAVPRGQVTFPQYREAIGVAWESSDDEGVKFVKVAVGIK